MYELSACQSAPVSGVPAFVATTLMKAQLDPWGELGKLVSTLARKPAAAQHVAS
jgi:hypothetical protein